MQPDWRDKVLSSGSGDIDFVAAPVTKSPHAHHSPAHAQTLLPSNWDSVLFHLLWEVLRVHGGADLP